MKNKLLIGLTGLATIGATMIPLSSCGKKTPEETKYDISCFAEDKIGYIIELVKPYFEYRLDILGLVKGDVVSTRISKSRNNKVKVNADWINHEITSEEVKQGFIRIKIEPSNPDPGQDVFSDIFSLTFTLLHNGEACLEKTIDNFSLDAAIPTERNMLDIDGTTLKGFNMDKKQELMQCGVLVIPSDITTIADNAFYNQTGYSDIFQSIKWLVLDGSLTGECALSTIGVSAFQDVPFTETLYIPKSVGIISDEAFRNCKKFSRLEFVDAQKSQLFSLGFRAFAGNQFYGTLSIPNNTKLHTIKEGAFGRTDVTPKNITKIVIPNNITAIQTKAFDGYANVTEIDLSSYSAVPEHGNWAGEAFYSFSKTGTIYVKNSDMATKWKTFFNTKVEEKYVFPDYINGTWELKVK